MTPRIFIGLTQQQRNVLPSQQPKVLIALQDILYIKEKENGCDIYLTHHTDVSVQESYTETNWLVFSMMTNMDGMPRMPESWSQYIESGQTILPT